MLGRRADGELLVKVLDFGLAKIVGLKGTTATRAGTVYGTAEYIAPERLAEGNEEDPRSDLYSLGVIAFELLTGSTPFRGKLVQVLAAHVSEPPAAPSTLRAGLSAALDALVLRCLAKHPEARFPTAQALRAALDSQRPGQPAVAPEEPTLRSESAPTLPPAELFETMPDAPRTTERMAAPVDDEERALAAEVELLEGLAYGLRDEGLGAPELSERVAILAQAFDALTAHGASLRELRRRAEELEMTARLREARLGQAENQLEHELVALAEQPGALRERLRARAAALTQRITGIGFELGEELDAIEERVSRQRQKLGPLRAEVEQQCQLLRALLERSRRELGDRCPLALQRLR